jgi:hypothetical protein
MNNDYGLDVQYFRKWLDRLSDISRYKPSELARELARMSRTADDKVMLEDEFAGERIAELAQELAHIKVLAEDRRLFIVNGEEFGYISKPTSETDSAYMIFMQCSLDDDLAGKQALAEHDAKVIEGLSNRVNEGSLKVVLTDGSKDWVDACEWIDDYAQALRDKE